jgi:hypothetical protein
MLQFAVISCEHTTSALPNNLLHHTHTYQGPVSGTACCKAPSAVVSCHNIKSALPKLFLRHINTYQGPVSGTACCIAAAAVVSCDHT